MTSWVGSVVARVATRRVTLDVRAGLYVLRYLGSPEARTAPMAFVTPAQGSVGDIDLVGVPGFRAEEMSGPGSNLVLVVRRPGTVDVAIEAMEGSANLDARFSLDLLAAGAEPRDRAEQVPSFRPAPEVLPADGEAEVSVSLLAHVARRGDIGPDAEGWIAGPRSPSAIEGFEVRCHGAEVGIAAQYQNATEQRPWSAWLTPGSFIGTRQRASPMTGLRLKLVGAAAGQFEIEGEALFLGSPKMVSRGGEIEFLASGTNDPLVGLRLRVARRRDRVRSTAPLRTPRVRVFR